LDKDLDVNPTESIKALSFIIENLGYHKPGIVNMSRHLNLLSSPKQISDRFEYLAKTRLFQYKFGRTLGISVEKPEGIDKVQSILTVFLNEFKRQENIGNARSPLDFIQLILFSQIKESLDARSYSLIHSGLVLARQNLIQAGARESMKVLY
jgi:hypothetical protein